jgi:4-amino-4-deoxy-L-arabinose transferase-like glycosyltransferase
MSESTETPAAIDRSDNARLARIRFLLVLALLTVGGAISYILLRTMRWSPLDSIEELFLLGAAAAIGAVALLPGNIFRIFDAIRNPSDRNRARTAAVIWAIAFVYLILTAKQQHRDLFPRIHDECSYSIQAKMLAGGRLWLPRHELADFFETFHFLTKPVYGSIYFPGTALMNVPGVWLRQPSWFMPVFLAALVIAMSYRVAAEMVDGLAGLLVALLILSTHLFRVYSTMVMAQVPIMLLGLLVAWAWLRWRRERRVGWAAAIGAFAGWAAITRPVDALAFAIPIGLAMAWDIRRHGIRTIARTAMMLIVGSLPFLTLQAVFDWGVTGNPFKTPYVMYLEQNQPGSVFGSGSDAMTQSGSELPQKQIYFSELTAMTRDGRKSGTLFWLENRARMSAMASLPFAAFLLLVPASLLVCPARGRWVVVSAAPICFGLYLLNPFYLLHYALPLTAAMAMAVVLGARAVQATIPFSAGRRFAGAFLSTAIVLLCVASLPQLNRHVSDEPYRTPLLDHVERTLARVPTPAVVFFHFAPGANVQEEPVYNLQTSQPDDAPIIRAQDLGPRDGELIRYYALRQPERMFYMLDRRTGGLFPLGNPIEAAATLHVPLNLPESATADVR